MVLRSGFHTPRQPESEGLLGPASLVVSFRLKTDPISQELHDEVVDLATWWRHIDGASWRHPEGPGSSVASRMQHPVVHVSYVDAKVLSVEHVGSLFILFIVYFV